MSDMTNAGELQAMVKEAGRLGLEISLRQQQQLIDYAELLMDWNQRMNLVRTNSRAELLRLHLLDSLWCGAAIDLGPVYKIMDLGSGAGLPGIPLKICWPHLHLALLETQQKRSLFLAEAINKLQLNDCEVLTGRAEELAHWRQQRERYDCVVARAVAPMAVLLELALPFVRTGGHLIALKGSGAPEELNRSEYALKLLGGAVETITPYAFPGERGRHVISITKVAPSPERYPRRTGLPAKRPLTGMEIGRKKENSVEGDEEGE